MGGGGQGKKENTSFARLTISVPVRAFPVIARIARSPCDVRLAIVGNTRKERTGEGERRIESTRRH